LGKILEGLNCPWDPILKGNGNLKLAENLKELIKAWELRNRKFGKMGKPI